MRCGGLCRSPFPARRSPPSPGSAARGGRGTAGESGSGSGGGRARLGGQAAPAARGSGKMALPGSLPAFVAQFHPLSSPTGAILRSFLLSPRRVGRCRRAQPGPYLCVSCGERSCPGLWEPLAEILKALLPSRTPHSFPRPWSPSSGAVKQAWLKRAHARSFNPANILYKLVFLPLKYIFLVIQSTWIKKGFQRTSERWPKNKTRH